jgi:ribonuclease E
MGLIVRTAGLSRTKTEIKRDFDYLARLWDEIRERTLKSSAPALIYRDSDLIKRAIRDLYHRDIDEVIVEGDDGYKAAKGFMKLLMPSHVRRVKPYADPTPIFQRFGVEDQLSAMYQPVVQLKSGGYLVINPTEALVSIDINSGRSTREHNIEQTAFATNLEAAAEIARQLRLRDMAGLIVIDFIDMEQSSHVRKVEKAMKEALKNDRARIQVGRISSFGLMEMSRQRLRTGVLEASTKPCQHCEGTGLMRTAASAGLSALRIVEDEAARGRGEKILLRAGREAAIYLLNKKRGELGEIEERYGVSVEVAIDEAFEGARMTVESSGPKPIVHQRRPEPAPIEEDLEEDVLEDEDEDEAEEQEDEEEEAAEARGPQEDRPGRRRRRRRRGGRGRRGGREDGDVPAVTAEGEQPSEGTAEETAAEQAEESEQPKQAAAPSGDRKRRRRRGRRGEPAIEGTAQAEIAPDSSPMVDRPIEEEPPIAAVEAPAEIQPEPAEDKKPKRRSRAKAAPKADAEVVDIPEPEPEPPQAQPVEVSEHAAPAKPARRSRSKKAAAAEPATADSAVPSADNDETEGLGEGDQPRRGWWQRTFG